MRSTLHSRSVRKLLYSFSIGLLVLLGLATLASPLVLPFLRTEQLSLSEMGRLQLLEAPDEWILQYNLKHEGTEEELYTFEITTEGQSNASTARVRAGGQYTFIYHLPLAHEPDERAQFTLLRSGQPEPVENVTLHLGALRRPS